MVRRPSSQVGPPASHDPFTTTRRHSYPWWMVLADPETGLKRVTIKVRVGPNVDAPSQEPLRIAGQGGTPKGRTEDLFDDRGLPRSDILVHLIDLFAQHFECQYPALDRHSLLRSAQEGSGSVFLLNCVAGMAARWVRHGSGSLPEALSVNPGLCFAADIPSPLGFPRTQPSPNLTYVHTNTAMRSPTAQKRTWLRVWQCRRARRYRH
jgi:hypothetical protein